MLAQQMRGAPGDKGDSVSPSLERFIFMNPRRFLVMGDRLHILAANWQAVGNDMTLTLADWTRVGQPGFGQGGEVDSQPAAIARG